MSELVTITLSKQSMDKLIDVIQDSADRGPMGARYDSDELIRLKAELGIGWHKDVNGETI